MSEAKCERVGKLVGGCKFEARYELGAPIFPNVKNLEMANPSDIERFRPKTYVRDVCVRCGKAVPRD